MIRNLLPDNFNYKTNDINFQIIDWKSYDVIQNDEEDEEEEEDIQDKKYKKKNKNLIIRGYGVTDNGNSICIHIEGFQPYFFFKIPQEWGNKDLDEFKNNVLKMVNEK